MSTSHQTGDTVPAALLGDWRTWAHLVAARGDELRVAVPHPDTGEATNRYRKAHWPQWQPHLPYAVYLGHQGRFHTLALDLDAKPGHDPAGDSAAVRRLLTDAGIHHVETLSSPAGGRHLIARFPAGLDAARVAAVGRALRAQVARSLDITPLLNVRTGALRPPLAPHRLGGNAVLLTPADHAYRVLTAGNTADSFRRLCQLLDVDQQPSLDDTQLDDAVQALPHHQRLPHLPGTPRALPERTRSLLTHGDPDGDYPDRSSLAAAICLSHVNARRPFGEFLTAAHDPHAAGLDHLRRSHQGHGRYQTRSSSETRKAAERMWRAAVRFALSHPAITDRRTEVEAALEHVAATAAAYPQRWGGQGGPSELATLQAILALALRCSSTAVGVDVRRLALSTGLTRSSTARALHRLHADGWLELLEAGTGTLAAVYQPVVPAALRPHRTTEPGPATHNKGVRPTGGTLVLAPHPLWSLPPTLAVKAHDTFTHAGLGRYASRVLTVLRDQPGPASLASLSVNTGLSVRTVRRSLRRLHEVQLLHGSMNAGYTSTWGDLDTTARGLGVQHTVERRAAGYANERALYRWYREDYRARAGWGVQRGRYRPGSASLPLPGLLQPPSVGYPRLEGRASWFLAERLLAQGDGPLEITSTVQPSREQPFGSDRDVKTHLRL